jgi:putative colanic acid biosynthesis UDP-glucose lipid carrier transferase
VATPKVGEMSMEALERVRRTEVAEAAGVVRGTEAAKPRERTESGAVDRCTSRSVSPDQSAGMVDLSCTGNRRVSDTIRRERASRNTIEGAAKYLFDWLACAAACLLFSPALIGIAIVVKASSRGPVLYTQRRRGRSGHVFTIYKFRTMCVHPRGGGRVVQATRDDPRVTAVGRWLRRTSLDELPQLFNVLKGDMSLVGPRPHAVEHDDLYEPLIRGYRDRQRVRPGITGWAQINGLRGETEHIDKMAARVAFDLYYVTNWSFLFDMQIIVRTVFSGFACRNAY